MLAAVRILENVMRVFERLRGAGRHETGIERKCPDLVERAPEIPEASVETSRPKQVADSDAAGEPSRH
jgi:hypothetical protein